MKKIHAITHDKILKASFKEFARKGFKAATTKGIAAATGINEVTLFRHFGSKRKLFISMMQYYAKVANDNSGALLHVTGDLRKDLVEIGGQFLQAMVKSREVIIMMISEAVRDKQVARIVGNQPHTQNRMLAQYFADQIQKGNFRSNLDVELTAQAFFALFFEYAIYLTSTGSRKPSKQKLQLITEQYVDIFIGGIAGK